MAPRTPRLEISAAAEGTRRPLCGSRSGPGGARGALRPATRSADPSLRRPGSRARRGPRPPGGTAAQAAALPALLPAPRNPPEAVFTSH